MLSILRQAIQKGTRARQWILDRLDQLEATLQEEDLGDGAYEALVGAIRETRAALLIFDQIRDLPAQEEEEEDA